AVERAAVVDLPRAAALIEPDEMDLAAEGGQRRAPRRLRHARRIEGQPLLHPEGGPEVVGAAVVLLLVTVGGAAAGGAAVVKHAVRVEVVALVGPRQVHRRSRDRDRYGPRADPVVARRHLLRCEALAAVARDREE